jgi:hypothetical protein
MCVSIITNVIVIILVLFKAFLKKKKKKIPQDETMYQNFIISYLYEAQHVSGDTPPIIRSLKLHRQPLLFIRGRLLDIVGHLVPDNVHQLHVQQPSTYEKPEDANAVLGS